MEKRKHNNESKSNSKWTWIKVDFTNLQGEGKIKLSMKIWIKFYIYICVKLLIYLLISINIFLINFIVNIVF